MVQQSLFFKQTKQGLFRRLFQNVCPVKGGDLGADLHTARQADAEACEQQKETSFRPPVLP